MVEGARLESVCRGNSTVGSNPTLSAIYFLKTRSAFSTQHPWPSSPHRRRSMRSPSATYRCHQSVAVDDDGSAALSDDQTVFRVCLTERRTSERELQNPSDDLHARRLCRDPHRACSGGGSSPSRPSEPARGLRCALGIACREMPADRGSVRESRGWPRMGCRNRAFDRCRWDCRRSRDGSFSRSSWPAAPPPPDRGSRRCHCHHHRPAAPETAGAPAYP